MSVDDARGGNAGIRLQRLGDGGVLGPNTCASVSADGMSRPMAARA